MLTILKPVLYILIWIPVIILSSRFSIKMEDRIIISKKEYITGFLCSLITGVLLFVLKIPLFDGCMLSLCLSLQFICACMDNRYKEVYDLFHIISLISMILLFFFGQERWKDINYLSMICFCVFQILFIFVYGLSDIFAFVIMGLIITYIYYPDNISQISIINNIMQGGLYLLSGMAIAYFIFFIMQLIKKNVNKWGNCKEKAPFIPAIFMTDILLLVFKIIMT